MTVEEAARAACAALRFAEVEHVEVEGNDVRVGVRLPPSASRVLVQLVVRK